MVNIILFLFGLSHFGYCGSSMTCKSVTCKSDVNWQTKHITHKNGIQMSYTERVTMLVLQIFNRCWVRSRGTGRDAEIDSLSKVVLSMNITIMSSSSFLIICVFVLFWNSRLRVIAELKRNDLCHTANIISRWVSFVCLFVFVFFVFCFVFSYRCSSITFICQTPDMKI